jgi:hypothetical protein
VLEMCDSGLSVACSEHSDSIGVAISVSAVGCRHVKFSCQSYGSRTGAGVHRFFENYSRQKDDTKQVRHEGPQFWHCPVQLVPGAVYTVLT